MAESEHDPTEVSSQSKLQKILKPAGLIIGILVPLITLILIFFRSLYDRNVLCSVDVDACRTRVALLEETLDPGSTQPPVIQTVRVTVVHTVIITSTPHPPAATASPTRDSYLSRGSCDTAFSNAPCTYVLAQGDRWQQIAQDSPYGDNCRYPEIMDVNRREDGNYPRLSGYDNDIGRPITILPAAPPGTYKPRIRNAMGKFNFIPECNEDGFPCIFTVSENLPMYTYEQVSQEVYKNNIFGREIAQANRAGDCSGDGITLQLGTQLVIPKRPLFTPQPNGG